MILIINDFINNIILFKITFVLVVFALIKTYNLELYLLHFDERCTPQRILWDE